MKRVKQESRLERDWEGPLTSAMLCDAHTKCEYFHQGWEQNSTENLGGSFQEPALILPRSLYPDSLNSPRPQIPMYPSPPVSLQTLYPFPPVQFHHPLLSLKIFLLQNTPKLFSVARQNDPFRLH